MKTLIIGDIHIEKDSIQEINSIFTEITGIKADGVILLGDFYDKNRPTPEELEYGTRVIKNLKAYYKDITLISGNGVHDFVNGRSIIEYLQYLGINAVVGDYVDNNMLFAHYMLYESKLQYGTGKCGIKDLAKYDKVFLGHQHTPQTLQKKRIWHVGSIRYCNWNESEDPFKRVMLIEDGKVKSIKLESPIPMINVHNLEELDQIDARSKVRWIISNFVELKNSAEIIKKYKDKFAEFKVKVDIKKEDNKPTEKVENGKLKELIYKGIEKIKDEDVKDLLKEQFKDENN